MFSIMIRKLKIKLKWTAGVLKKGELFCTIGATEN